MRCSAMSEDIQSHGEQPRRFGGQVYSTGLQSNTFGSGVVESAGTCGATTRQRWEPKTCSEPISGGLSRGRRSRSMFVGLYQRQKL